MGNKYRCVSLHEMFLCQIRMVTMNHLGTSYMINNFTLNKKNIIYRILLFFLFISFFFFLHIFYVKNLEFYFFETDFSWFLNTVKI